MLDDVYVEPPAPEIEQEEPPADTVIADQSVVDSMAVGVPSSPRQPATVRPSELDMGEITPPRSVRPRLEPGSVAEELRAREHASNLIDNWQRTQTTGAGVGLLDRITAMQEPGPEPGSATSPTGMMAFLARKTDNHEDHWENDRVTWVRMHTKPRLAMFTPAGISNGPDVSKLSGVRRTVGTYLDTGEEFEILDDWTRPNCHEALPSRWVGTTEFVVDVPKLSLIHI